MPLGEARVPREPPAHAGLGGSSQDLPHRLRRCAPLENSGSSLHSLVGEQLYTFYDGKTLIYTSKRLPIPCYSSFACIVFCLIHGNRFTVMQI